MQILRNKEKDMLFLNQHNRVIKILKKFNKFDCKPVTLSLANILNFYLNYVLSLIKNFLEYVKFLMVM